MADQTLTITLSERAKEFATKAHAAVDHRRKYTDEPYIVHPIEVAGIVAMVTDDEAMLAAAYLHDTVEDTGVTLETIEKEFGSDVAALVEQLTDVSKPTDGKRAVRRELDRQHTAKASPRAKTIKLADLISNSKTLLQHELKFARVYFDEQVKLLEVLTEGDPKLYKIASDQLTRNRALLSMNI
jgi:(p)ppGpp synthase/HD superfamily hydrolase